MPKPRHVLHMLIASAKRGRYPSNTSFVQVPCASVLLAAQLGLPSSILFDNTRELANGTCHFGRLPVRRVVTSCASMSGRRGPVTLYKHVSAESN